MFDFVPASIGLLHAGAKLRRAVVNPKLKCPLFSQVEMSPFLPFFIQALLASAARQAEGKESGSGG